MNSAASRTRGLQSALMSVLTVAFRAVVEDRYAVPRDGSCSWEVKCDAAVAGYEAAPGGWGRSVVTIGVFDGVHRGHQEIIGHAVKRARELGVASVVVTFDPHPSEVVRPGSHPAVLTEPARKAELIEALGVDVLCVIPFTLGVLPAVAPRRSSTTCWSSTCTPALVVVGENFRFGHKAAGDVALLSRLGPHVRLHRGGRAAGRRRTATVVLVDVHPQPASTPATWPRRPRRWAGRTGWRAWWCAATSAAASWASRRPTCCATAYAAVPADGVYAGLAGPRAGTASRCAAAVSIGTNPTFSGGSAGSRRTCWTSPATSTASGWRWTSSPACGSSAATTGSSRWSRRSHEDVAQTRAP